MLAPNTLLQNRYLVIRHLSKGGMGAVYLVKHQKLGKNFALKQTFFSANDELLKAFEREAQLLANLDHPALPKVIDHFAEGESQYLVMEYVEGEDLGKQLIAQKKPFPVKQVLEWADQLLDALSYLHTNDPPIIHRDIKPENLKLTQKGRIMLLDFGLAKGAIAEMTQQIGSVWGYTLDYAPMEQIKGAGTDERSDLYSLGVTLYHLMTGIIPPRVTDRNEAIGDGQPDPLRPANELNPEVSFEVAAVLQKALARNRDKRHESAAVMRQALRVAQQETQVEPFPSPTLPAPREEGQQTLPLPKALTYPHPAPHGTEPPIEPHSISPIRREEILTPRIEPAKRRGKLWIGVALFAVIIGLAMAANLGLFSRKNSSPANQSGANSGIPSSSKSPDKPPETPRSTPASTGMSPLNSFQFNTVTLDSKGNVTEKRTGQARFYTEDLGNGVTLEMVEIPSGTFTMGSPVSEQERSFNEGPQHQVSLPKFYMGKFEVTQAQWKALMGGGNPSHTKGDNLPVESIDWADAVEFCNRLSKKTGREYRLPSEAEWEYAARAGTQTTFAFGDTITPEIVNYNGNVPYAGAAKGIYRERTIPVGSLGVANGFGLYDMHGNVWEWCLDHSHNNYNGAPTDGSVWSGGDKYWVVVRGGSCFEGANYARSAERGEFGPGAGSSYVSPYALGFRVVSASHP